MANFHQPDDVYQVLYHNAKMAGGPFCRNLSIPPLGRIPKCRPESSPQAALWQRCLVGPPDDHRRVRGNRSSRLDFAFSPPIGAGFIASGTGRHQVIGDFETGDGVSQCLLILVPSTGREGARGRADVLQLLVEAESPCRPRRLYARAGSTSKTPSTVCRRGRKTPICERGGLRSVPSQAQYTRRRQRAFECPGCLDLVDSLLRGFSGE